MTDPVLGDGTASYTPGISVRSGGNVRYQHTGLKNTDSQTSPAQSVAASRVYDAFGNVVSSSGTWTGGRQEFQSQTPDEAVPRQWACIG